MKTNRFTWTRLESCGCPSCREQVEWLALSSQSSSASSQTSSSQSPSASLCIRCCRRPPQDGDLCCESCSRPGKWSHNPLICPLCARHKQTNAEFCDLCARHPSPSLQTSAPASSQSLLRKAISAHPSPSASEASTKHLRSFLDDVASKEAAPSQSSSPSWTDRLFRLIAVVVVALLSSPILWQIIEVQKKQDELRVEVEQSQHQLEELREDLVDDQLRLRALQIDQKYMRTHVERMGNILYETRATK